MPIDERWLSVTPEQMQQFAHDWLAELARAMP